MIPKTKTYWANVYKMNDGRIIVTDPVTSLENEYISIDLPFDYVKTISFEIEE